MSLAIHELLKDVGVCSAIALWAKTALIFVSLGKLSALFKDRVVLWAAEVMKALLFVDQSHHQNIRGHTNSVKRARSLSDSIQK